MSKKGLVEEAKDTLVDAAKVGAQGVKSVGSEALGAAATAAAGVVLGRVSQALGAGQEKVEEAVPPFRAAAGDKVKIADRSKKAKSSRMKTRAAKKKKSASARRTTGKKKPAEKKQRQRNGPSIESANLGLVSVAAYRDASRNSRPRCAFDLPRRLTRSGAVCQAVAGSKPSLRVLYRPELHLAECGEGTPGLAPSARVTPRSPNLNAR